MSCYCDYDPPALWSREMRRAAKVHRCEECRAHILEGDRYEYVSGMWDGYFCRFRTCALCVDLRQWVTNNLPCFCWAHGNLHEDAHEAVQDAAWRAGEEVNGIRFGLGRRLVQIRRRYAETRLAA